MYADRSDQYDDAGPAQGLWAVTIVVTAVVLSFLFGRYVVGERLRGPREPAAVASGPLLGGTALPQPAPAVVTPEPTQAATPIPPPPAEGGLRIINEATDGAAPATTAATIDAGIDAAAARPDPLAGGRPVRQPRAAETTTRASEPEPRTSSKSGSATIRGGYDTAQPGKPFRPGSGGTAPATKTKTTEPAKPATKIEPTKTTAAPKPAPSSADEPGTRSSGKTLGPAPTKSVDADAWRVQAGSYASRERAEDYSKQLADKGHKASIRQAEVGGKTYYRVVISSHSDEKGAREAAGKLADEGLEVSIEH